ncbi:MAG: hypothetical protein WAV86_14885 [Lutibacter sp.]
MLQNKSQNNFSGKKQLAKKGIFWACLPFWWALPLKKWSGFPLQSFFSDKNLKKVFPLQSLTRNELRFKNLELRFVEFLKL